jgi:hypothetical protein
VSQQSDLVHIAAADRLPATLKVTEHVVNLYMHEVAMHVDHNVDEFKPPFTEAALRGVQDESKGLSLTPAHISALSVCLESIDGIFETFLTLDIETIRCLPVANFVRVAYAVVVLIKMYFAAATPGSELGKVIDKENMKVEQYLDGLVEIFKASAAEEKSRPSAKFLMVLIMLKTWFHRHREGRGPGSNQVDSAFSASATENTAESTGESAKNGNPQASRNAQKPGYSPANTPLQLLSEVATGSGDQSRSASVSHHPVHSNDWNQQKPYSNSNYSAVNPMLVTQGFSNSNNSAGNIDPNLGTDLSYNMGDGFEQAMGMTLGVGEFGSYFSDDTFFSGFMNSEAGFEGFGM